MPAAESLNIVRRRIGDRIAEIEQAMPRLAPQIISAKMDAIRSLAAEHGLVALEGLADYAAHHAMMPGCREATRSCLEHMEEALDGEAANAAHDRETILASLAVRLH